MSSDLNIAKPFIDAVVVILSTMAGIKPKVGTPFVKKDKQATGDVTGFITLSGDKSGSIAVSFELPCALALVRGLLGDDVEDIIQDAEDAVGEVTNMISGRARAKLSEQGITMSGSTPTTYFEPGLEIPHIIESGRVIAIPFNTEYGDFSVEFCFS
ncbi:chemotaxis protein CheX [Desulfovibrio litoralis]|uniref:Chemotaxis protein CheX n=1 Tax=Desulfovibrio litoralis DSM 11393 TaxID=1121455 RepID=A0A1M7RU10_9BACT|nr:chemotaxis protein CheX [Desulfovibrio litoralis]SHN49741.1 chemotaxis protein CheX [Desulfovibrio litoralis DSM 11393]